MLGNPRGEKSRGGQRDCRQFADMEWSGRIFFARGGPKRKLSMATNSHNNNEVWHDSAVGAVCRADIRWMTALGRVCWWHVHCACFCAVFSQQANCVLWSSPRIKSWSLFPRDRLWEYLLNLLNVTCQPAIFFIFVQCPWTLISSTSKRKASPQSDRPQFSSVRLVGWSFALSSGPRCDVVLGLFVYNFLKKLALPFSRVSNPSPSQQTKQAKLMFIHEKPAQVCPLGKAALPRLFLSPRFSTQIFQQRMLKKCCADQATTRIQFQFAHRPGAWI